MDLSAANQLARFVRRHQDKRLWVLDEQGNLEVGWYPQRIEKSKDWTVISLSLCGDGPDPETRVLQLDRIPAVKVEVSADESMYFGDRRRIIEAEVELGLEAAQHEDAAGHYDAALARSQEALDLVARELGPRHQKHPHALASVADALRRLGRFEQARARAELACSLADELLDARDPLRPAIHQVAACLYTEMGELEPARLLAQEVHDLLVAQGAEAPAMAEALATLSLVESRRGRLSEAVRLARQGLDLLARDGGTGSVTSARLQHHAGMSLCLSGQLDEAHSLLRESLAERQRILGEAHPESIDGAASLATLYLVRGDLALAVSLFRRVLTLAERVYGCDHIRVADYAVYLAVAYRKLGTEASRTDAASLLERSRRIRIEAL